jgi:hypothetical protein
MIKLKTRVDIWTLPNSELDEIFKWLREEVGFQKWDSGYLFFDSEYNASIFRIKFGL